VFEWVHEKPMAPLASESCTVTAAVWLSVLAVPYSTDVSAIAPLVSVNVQVGCWTSSDGSRVMVITSPSLASPDPLVASVAEVEVGAVVSRV
jgi:hypothetical protein